MKYAICPLSVVPIRSEGSDKEEIISEILFGEVFKVLERRAKWSRIRLFNDGYEGWICNKQYALISQEEYERISKYPALLCSSPTGIVTDDQGNGSYILLGSSLPAFDNGKISLAQKNYTFQGEHTSGVKDKSEISSIAKLFVRAPYLWGGRSFFGIDCSGFAQMVYKLSGRQLPRDARDQALCGDALSFIEEAEEGDLAFFDNQDGNINHVGIILSDRRIIHASGQVRIDQIDQTGIFNSDTNSYTHKLRVIKRIAK